MSREFWRTGSGRDGGAGGAAAGAGLEIIGQPRFARFDPPWTPRFLRHNEVVLPVAGDPESGTPSA